MEADPGHPSDQQNSIHAKAILVELIEVSPELNGDERPEFLLRLGPLPEGLHLRRVYFLRSSLLALFLLDLLLHFLGDLG